MLRKRQNCTAAGIILAAIITASAPALAASATSAIQVTYRNIKVNIDGRIIVTEREPFIFEGNTYLAAKDIAEAFGCEIRFNESANTLEITSRQTTPTPPTQTPVSSFGAATNRRQRPTNPSITKERADEIAVEWLRARGHTGTWRDGGIKMDFEYGRWVWELERKINRQEWDFYICVMTGEIVHVDVDWD